MIRRRLIRYACATVAALILCVPVVQAWHDEGHYYTAVAAARALPGDVPAFFREGAAAIGHNSLDPDVFKDRNLPQLNHCEFPEHFIDIELLKGHELPPLRYDYVRLCQRLEVDPAKAGTLPYAITEWTQKLTMAFAEHRAHPDNAHIRAKCLVYAGTLAHYAADLHMPLHTSIHWDGRAEEGVPYVRTGIHNKVDALPTKVPYNELFAEPLPTPLASSDVFTFVLDELAKSHALVDRVYEMEQDYPEWDDLNLDNEAVHAFTIERTRAAAAFTADLYLSAWRNSADITPPAWLDRRIFDDSFDPATVPPQPDQGRN
jgi:hypothetical protein